MDTTPQQGTKTNKLKIAARLFEVFAYIILVLVLCWGFFIAFLGLDEGSRDDLKDSFCESLESFC